MIDKKYLQKAIDLWGLDSQLDMLTEECGELISAVNKFKRSRIEQEKLAQEIVDVELMCMQIKEIIDSDVYESILKYKVERFINLLHESENERINNG